MEGQEAFNDLYEMALNSPRAFIIALSFLGMDSDKGIMMLRIVKQSKGDYQWYKSITGSRCSLVRADGLTLMFRRGSASWA